jgi:transposase
MIVSTEGVREKMPAAHPEEFRRRAVELARLREKPIAQIARDLRISESCLRRWIDQADVEDGHKEGLTKDERAELVRLRREKRVLEMEVAAPAGSGVMATDSRTWSTAASSPMAQTGCGSPDITQHRTCEGWVYAAVVLDVYFRRVVGRSIADHLRTELVADALDMARLRRKPVGTVIHSDRGTQGGF